MEALVSPQDAAEDAFLKACSITDFEVLTGLGGGANGIAVLVRCAKPGHPYPWKTYALKVIKNYDASSTRTLRNKYEAEFDAFAHIGSHRRVVRLRWQFVDIVPEAVLALFTELDQELLRNNEFGVPRGVIKTQYGLFDAHPQHVQEYRLAVRLPVLPAGEFWRIARQVLEGLMHLEARGVLHRDVKLDNVLVKLDGCVCICDLGEALILVSGACVCVHALALSGEVVRAVDGRVMGD